MNDLLTAEDLAAHIDLMAADSIAIGRHCAEVHYLEDGLPPDAGELEDLKQGFRAGSATMLDSRFVCREGQELPEDLRKVLVEFLALSAVRAFLLRVNQIARGEAAGAWPTGRARVPS
ncbi:hypothetical protein [Kaistia sp. UC242_56]|uniref:hypothetical protein n=1 Tax=Kaistia sp. UC242_56 TaxID=3374625 RepID=UPI0037A9842E